MKILSNKDKVLKLLKENYHLRDDDFKLMANIWYGEIKNPLESTAFEFLKDFSNGKHSHPETIRRIRAKLQEEFPELRGKNYKKRQNHSEDVKRDLFETPEILKGGTP